MSALVKMSCKCVCGVVAVMALNSCGLLSIGSSPTEVAVPPIPDQPQVEAPSNLVEPIPQPHTSPPTAVAVAGRKGFVLNPFTGNVVDVRGLRSGLLVRDPEDPDRTHTFRVPEFE